MKASESERASAHERESWPLHDIAITNIVWCIAYKGRVGGGAYIAQWLCISIAIVLTMQVRRAAIQND